MQEYKTIEQKRKFYNSGSWKKLRKQVKERDNFRMPGVPKTRQGIHRHR